MLAKLKQRWHRLRAETLALSLAARHPRTPWYAKLLVAAIVAYALSPVDLIPDFVPVLGHLDDLVLVPLGIALAVRLIPDSVLDDCRVRARDTLQHGTPPSRVAGAVVIVIWIATAALCAVWAYKTWMR